MTCFDKPGRPVGNVQPIIDTLTRESSLESGMLDTLVSTSSNILEPILPDWSNAAGKVVGLKGFSSQGSEILSLA